MKIRTLAVIAVLLLGLTLTACTRQASTATVPTQPPAQPTSSVAEDPTMAAVRQTAAAMATEAAVQTAAAVTQPAGGEATAAAVATPEAKELPSATPAAVETAVAAPTQAAPAPTATPTAVTCGNVYVVQQGDWVYKIARLCRMDPLAILAANPGVSPNYIIPGQKLNLPTGAAAAPSQTCTGNYTVVKGDTLFSIAYRCGLTTEEMAAKNGLVFPFRIYPGDVLKFP